MTEIFFPLRPRPREDPASAGVVQTNLEYVMQLFQKGVEDGDILVWDKVLGRYLAEAAGGVQSVTALPIVDLKPGKEIILQDSLTAPTYHWHLRYNPSSTSPYKWECIGGMPAIRVTTAVVMEQTASTTYTNLATVGPDLQLPAGVGGDFSIAVGGGLWHDIVNNRAFMSYDLGAVGAIDSDAASGSTANPISVYKPRRKNGIASGALIRCKYRSSTGANSARFEPDRWLQVMPYRVG